MSSSEILLLVGLIIALALLAVLLPEGLRWLARRNRRQRDDLVRGIRCLERDLEHASQELARFEQRGTKRYRSLYEQIEPLLRRVQADRQAMMHGNRWRFPTVPAKGWVGRYFVDHPGDMVVIGQMFWRLRQAQAQLAADQAVLAQTRPGLKDLHETPVRLQGECTAVQKRLETLAADLQRERQAGIRLPATWGEEHGRYHSETRRLQQELSQPERVSDDEAEQIDADLTAVENGLAELEEAVQLVRRGREGFEVREQAAVTAVTHLRARIPTEKVPTGLPLLFQNITALQTEARQLAHQMSFTEAATLLDDSQRLATFGESLLSATFLVNDLKIRQADAVDPTAIEQLTARLGQVYEELNGQIGGAETRRPYAPFAATVNQALAALTTQCQQIQTQAQSMQDQYQVELQRLEREANQKAADLNKAWEAMQRTIRLADGDRLAKRVRENKQERESAHGRPARLKEYVTEAAELTQDIRQSNAYLQERLQKIRAPLEAMPTFVSQVEQEAGEWHCLRPQVNSVKEKAAAIQQIWPTVTQKGWLDEAHKLLDELKLLNQQCQLTYKGMSVQADQLNRLVAQINEIIDHIEPGRRNSATEKAEMRYNWAQQEPDFAKAVASLEDAKRIVTALDIQ